MELKRFLFLMCCCDCHCCLMKCLVDFGSDSNFTLLRVCGCMKVLLLTKDSKEASGLVIESASFMKSLDIVECILLSFRMLVKVVEK
jgi:hypothetical protein